MNPEPESLILQLLRDMRVEIGDVRTDIGDEQIVGLSRAVIEYRTSSAMAS